MHAESASERPILLCFNVASSHGDNLVASIAYPAGYSYHEPFRYRDEWIEPSLLAQASLFQHEDSFDRAAVICARFSTGGRLTADVLPLRSATITKVDALPDFTTFYFKLGPLFDFTDARGLSLTRFRADDAAARYLAFESPLNTLPSAVEETKETAAWVRLCDLLADSDLPLDPDLRKSCFVRLEKPLKSGSEQTEEIDASPLSGPLYGSALREGAYYRMRLFHRVPAVAGQDVTVTGRLDYESDSPDVEVGAKHERIDSHYQVHEVSIAAILPTDGAASVFVSWPTSTSGPPGRRIRVRIPVSVRPSVLYRLKRQWVWYLLLWVALLATSLTGASSASGPSTSTPAANNATASSPATNTPQGSGGAAPGIIRLITSGLATAALFVIQERVKK